MQCKAKSKRSGQQCKNHAVIGWEVCRMHGAGGGRPRKDGTPASTTWERQLTTFLLKKRDSTHLEELQTDIELLKIVISRLDKKIITALEAKQDTSHKEKPFV